jgi:hypothetical protein
VWFAPPLPTGRVVPQPEPCDDLYVHLFCQCCAIAQECRELKIKYGPDDKKVAPIT